MYTADIAHRPICPQVAKQFLATDIVMVPSILYSEKDSGVNNTAI